jgi:hypothetical protein
MSARGWWYQASTAERLAQIDGCIEVGMTTNQCAMNLGCYDARRGDAAGNGIVGNFARRHGRSFPNIVGKRRLNAGMVTVEGHSLTRKQARINASKQAYLSGEPVDFWSAK